MHVMLTVNSCWNVLNFRLPLVKTFLDKGYKVSVLAPVDRATPTLRRLGCHVVPLEMSAKGLNPIEGVQLQRAFGRAFRAHQPDVVLSYTIKNNLFGAMSARRLGIPFIPNITGLGTAFLSGGALQKVAETLYRLAFRDVPVVFFQNSDDRALFELQGLVAPGQGQLLPGSGIDLERFRPAPLPNRDAPVFLMIARLLRDKGVHEYVEAARRVQRAAPSARFQLLGAIGAANRSAIDAATVDTWVNDGTIEYLGTTDDVRPFIADANCLVLPSYREGAPRTLLEGAAMARPLIATDVAGCRSIVEDGRNGYLCAPRSADSLADAIEGFIRRPAEAQRQMGLVGRRKMELSFDHRFVVDAYERAVERVTRPTLQGYPVPA